MQYDVWAVKVKSNDNFYVTAVSPSAAGALALKATTPGINGYGYKVSIKSSTNESGKNFTIVGTTVGGAAVTETIAGPNNTTVYTTNYFAKVTSVSTSASGGSIEVGYGGNLALPMTRIKGLYYVSAASNAGSIIITRNSNSLILLEIDTPSASSPQVNSLYMAAEGIRTAYSIDDFAVVAVTSVTSVTLICG